MSTASCFLGLPPLNLSNNKSTLFTGLLPRLIFYYPGLPAQDWHCAQLAEFPHTYHQSRKYPFIIPTELLYDSNFSIEISPTQMILSCLNLAKKTKSKTIWWWQQPKHYAESEMEISIRSPPWEIRAPQGKKGREGFLSQWWWRTPGGHGYIKSTKKDSRVVAQTETASTGPICVCTRSSAYML